MKKKRKIKKVIKIGGALLITFVGAMLFAALTTKPVVSSNEADAADMYDDKEFYDLTHNDDGTLNDYGKSLDD
jgi:hypothetical protein